MRRTPLHQKRKGRKKVRKPNVFDQIGFSPEEAEALTIKRQLHAKILRCAKNYTQAELKKILRVSQPRVSDLQRGKLANFSLETLIEYAVALKMKPEIRTHEPVAMIAAQAEQ